MSAPAMPPCGPAQPPAPEAVWRRPIPASSTTGKINRNEAVSPRTCRNTAVNNNAAAKTPSGSSSHKNRASQTGALANRTNPSIAKPHTTAPSNDQQTVSTKPAPPTCFRRCGLLLRFAVIVPPPAIQAHVHGAEPQPPPARQLPTHTHHSRPVPPTPSAAPVQGHNK